jgi:hypothetical protein
LKTPFLIALFCLNLVACASAPAPIEYYRINSLPTKKAELPNNANAIRVVVESVELPSFLSQPGLVMQSAPHQITISKNHLWAERLDKAVPRLLVSKLQDLSDNYIFYLGGHDWVEGDYIRFRLRIDNLQPTLRGKAVTSGKFQLIDVKPGQPPVSQDFSFSSNLQRDGYAAAVAQLEYLIAQIAKSMLEALQRQEDESS